MIKILFFIHDLGQGGAEKVLVNLVNNMDKQKFDITVMSLFGGGVNEQFLNPDIHYISVFKKTIPANSKLMKLLSPKQLHRMFVREEYDIEISYLEGPTARIISGCEDRRTKKCCWIHSNHFSENEVASSFRSYEEAVRCYNSYDKIICVSQFMRDNFCEWIPVTNKCEVLYNTVESEDILRQSNDDASELAEDGAIRLVAIGSLKEIKGFDRLLRIAKRLKEDRALFHLYILGKGPLKKQLEDFVSKNALNDCVSLLGYQMNPYKFVAKCDLFVCSSHSEGFSTAATEALIVGTPVCTVEVSGMKEMLGEGNEYGLVVPNDEESLFQGIKSLLDDRELLEQYKKQAEIRGRMFSTKNTVKAVEEMLENL